MSLTYKSQFFVFKNSEIHIKLTIFYFKINFLSYSTNIYDYLSYYVQFDLIWLFSNVEFFVDEL